VGFKIAIVLILGEKFKNFNGQADVCRACERACVPQLTAKCEALVVSLPTSTSIEPLELPARQQSRLSRKHIHTLWSDVKERHDNPLYERLLALNAEAPSRSPEDQLVLLPVPPGYTVHISNRPRDNYTQGAYTVLGAQGGQVRLREVGGSRVLTVNVDRIDARVIDPRMQVIGDDWGTLQAQIAALRDEMEALRLQKEHEKDLLRGEITSLQSNATEQAAHITAVSKERDHAIAQHDAAYQKGQGACLADQQRRDQT